METITELRVISQKTRQTAIYKMNWFDRNVLRRLSIYLTSIGVKLGVEANIITAIDFMFVLASGMCFLSPFPIWWLAGLVLFWAYLLVDCVDGEVARYMEYKGTRKPQPLGLGSFLGGCVDAFVWPFIFACMSFGLYRSSGSILPVAFGFSAAVMRMLYMDLGIIPYPILHDYDRLSSIKSSTNTLGEPRLMSMGRLLFGIQGFLPCMLAVILFDLFIIPGILARNAYLLVFALAATVGVLLRIVNVAKHGVRIQRI